MIRERMASSDARPPALRMSSAFADLKARELSGCRRASVQATIANSDGLLTIINRT